MAASPPLAKLCTSAGPQAEEALALLTKILANIMEHPQDPKFRRLNPGSEKLQGTLLRHAGAAEFLTSVGFVRAADGTFELPQGKEGGLSGARAQVGRQTENLRGSQIAQKMAAAYRTAVDGGVHGAGLAEVEALAGSPAGLEALQLLERILTNLRRYPDSEKYRCVNLAKASGQKVAPAAKVLEVAGFKKDKLPTGEDCMQLARRNTDVLERVWAMVYWATRPGPPPELPAAKGALGHALGAVLGAAVGDALGAPLGGLGPLEVSAEEVDKAMEMCGGGVWGVAPGQVTGNTELLICLAQGLADAKAPLKEPMGLVEDLAVLYGKWGKSMPFRAEKASLQVFQRPLPATDMRERARELNQKSIGSGALLRCAPLAAVAPSKPELVANLARTDASLSHPSATVGNASAVLAMAAAHLVATGGNRRTTQALVQEWLQREKAAEQAGTDHGPAGGSAAAGGRTAGWTHLSRGEQARVQQRPAPQTDEALWQAPGERLVAAEVVIGWLKSAFGEAELPFSEGSAGALLDGEVGSVEIPFLHAFRHLRQNSTFEAAMRAVLAGGGDSCATAAAVGGLIGAAVGVEGIPKRWVRAVLSSDLSMGQTRPPEYHPSCLPDLMQKICSHAAG